jgi:hypothetical protein
MDLLFLAINAGLSGEAVGLQHTAIALQSMVDAKLLADAQLENSKGRTNQVVGMLLLLHVGLCLLAGLCYVGRSARTKEAWQ